MAWIITKDRNNTGMIGIGNYSDETLAQCGVKFVVYDGIGKPAYEGLATHASVGPLIIGQAMFGGASIEFFEAQAISHG